MQIREVQQSDFESLKALLDAAFESPVEFRIVASLRETEFWIPELTLVVIQGSEIVAFAMISRITLENSEMTSAAFALGPVAVKAAMQKQGIGSALIRELLSRFDSRCAAPLLVLGAPEYYSRFGFSRADRIGIYPPMPWSNEHFMIRNGNAPPPPPHQIAIYPDAWRAEPNILATTTSAERTSIDQSSIDLRRATADDAKVVARVFAIAFRYQLPHLPNLHSAEEDIAHFLGRINNEHVWLAEDRDGMVVGFIAFASNFVSNLWVLPRAQKRGIGKQLLHKAMDGSNTVELWTFQRNQNAREFYKRMGFVEIKLSDGADNDEKEPDVLLRWTR